MSGFRKWLGAIKRGLQGDTNIRIHELRRRVNSIDAMLRCVIDVRSMPKAVGRLRLQQVADVALLKVLSGILDSHGLRYWLESGSLLGAVRHNGFVPWDDDIDISMLREDYIKAFTLLKDEFADDGRFRAIRSNCIRIQLVGTPCQIDIFPYDEYRAENGSLPNEVLQKWNVFHKTIKLDWRRLKTDGQVLSGMSFDDIDSKSRILSAQTTGSEKFIMAGFEVHGDTDFLMPYDKVFPLARHKFEGEDFWCPNDPDKMLSMQMGDYFALPPTFEQHADLQARFSEDAIRRMNMIIREMRLENILWS